VQGKIRECRREPVQDLISRYKKLVNILHRLFGAVKWVQDRDGGVGPTLI
jgi:hypothetical protein